MVCVAFRCVCGVCVCGGCVGVGVGVVSEETKKEREVTWFTASMSGLIT